MTRHDLAFIRHSNYNFKFIFSIKNHHNDPTWELNWIQLTSVENTVSVMLDSRYGRERGDEHDHQGSRSTWSSVEAQTRSHYHRKSWKHSKWTSKGEEVYRAIFPRFSKNVMQSGKMSPPTKCWGNLHTRRIWESNHHHPLSLSFCREKTF